MDPSDPDPGSATWVVAESTPQARPRPRWRRWIWVVAGIASALGAAGLSLVALERVPTNSSADMPLPDNARLGFRGMRGIERWTCNDGHDHLSVPYWSGILGLGAVAVACWVRAGRDGHLSR